MNKEKAPENTAELFTEDLAHCPICGQRDWEYFGGRYHFDLRIEYWICTECLLVGQSPHIPAERLGEFYSLHYRKLYMGSSEPTEEEFEFQKKRGRNLLQLAAQQFPELNFTTVLDYGCSAGGLLEIARNELGAQEVLGIELDVAYGNHARSLGATVFPTVGEAIKEGIPPIDIITMSHVLEHIPALEETLRTLHGMLSEKGIIAIEVPSSAAGACFQLAHPWGFNPTSLNRLLAKVGFGVKNMITHGYPRDPENKELYLVALASRLKPDQVTFVPKPSSAFQERKKRYITLHRSETHQAYSLMLLKNTLKQLLRKTNGQLMAHSIFPSKLQGGN